MYTSQKPLFVPRKKNTISRITAFGGTAFVPRLRRDRAEQGAERTCFQLSVDAPAALLDSELTEISTAQFRPASACHAVDVNATMPQGARRLGRGGGGGPGRNKDTSRRPASGRGATKARRTSSGGTGRCESEASIPPRSAIRVSQIRQCYKQCTWRHDRSLADELIRHKDSKGGRAQRGFVEGLVTRTNGVAPLLEITRDDINDEVKRRKKKKKKEVERPLNRLPKMLLQSYKQRRIGREQGQICTRHCVISAGRTRRRTALSFSRHESVDLCEDADGDGSNDEDAEDEDAAAADGDYERGVN
ncbi:hypothetical protein THAOC_15907 [Thalassiosira oceanica]|uniref:Uncharacterized protein n=1 Tax=Thalassiosira oceanica TaxID=159749 RepID=K0SDG6_THAOC|nr:hypothetical protein THAOC_15907 [Thalassiosira oceanica]|eukprot:EJK63430.1 hypothetical protein THAOC_15907 [Thalassiosira oceanica]